MNEAYFVKLLNVFCPMHLVLDAAGAIVHAGPTLRKITGKELVGAPFLQTFEVKRPQGVTTLEALRESLGSRVALRLKSAQERAFLAQRLLAVVTLKPPRRWCQRAPDHQ